MSKSQQALANFDSIVRVTLVVLIAFASMAFDAQGITVDAPLQSHGPVLIVGNAGFTPANGVVSGTGTPSDPYVIEGWDFDLGSLVVCRLPCGVLTVENTTANLVIEGVRFTGSESNARAGIYLHNVTDASILNSLVSPKQNLQLGYQFGEPGFLISNSSRIIVQGNGLTGGGVDVHGSKNVTISRNSFFSAGGVGLGSSSRVLIYDNNFYDFFQSAPLDTTLGDNQWDDGYPAGGNYWGTPRPYYVNASPGPYTDNCSGPRQDICTGPDGISDISYCAISAGYNCTNVDRYPLMRPYGFAPHIVPPIWSDLHQSLNITSVASNSIVVTWPTPNTPDVIFSNVTSEVVSYRIYLGSQEHDIYGPIPCFGNGTLVGTVSSTSNRFVVEGLNSSTHYVLWVEAVDSSDNVACLSGAATTVAVWQQYWYVIAGAAIGGVFTLLLLGYQLKRKRGGKRAPVFKEELQHLTR